MILIDNIIEEIINIYRNNHKLYICGNGGSATHSEHFAAELVVNFKIREHEQNTGFETGHSKLLKGFPAISLNSQNAIITAISNDIGYEYIFSQQINVYANPSDMLICFSTSGRSPNIINALRTAKHMGLITVLFTSEKYTSNYDFVDYIVKANTKETSVAQEHHLEIIHYISEQIERRLFRKKEII